jgi:arylmalonate decarboxylase
LRAAGSVIMADMMVDSARDMRSDITIGLVVPFASDQVPIEGPIMYPGVRFVPKGVGVRALTPDGYESAFNGIIPAAERLAAQGVEAIMVIGTSLTFYRGYDAHELLLDRLRRSTGLPVSTMSEAIVDGLRTVGAREIAVCTAYSDEVNERLAMFLTMAGFDVLALQGFGLTEFGGPAQITEDEIVALCDSVYGQAPEAQGLLISCGGLRTLGVAKPVEERHGVPVVSSATAAFWSAMRLVGESGHVAGYGRLFEQSSEPVN